MWASARKGMARIRSCRWLSFSYPGNGNSSPIQSPCGWGAINSLAKSDKAKAPFRGGISDSIHPELGLTEQSAPRNSGSQSAVFFTFLLLSKTCNQHLKTSVAVASPCLPPTRRQLITRSVIPYLRSRWKTFRTSRVAFKPGPVSSAGPCVHSPAPFQ